MTENQGFKVKGLFAFTHWIVAFHILGTCLPPGGRKSLSFAFQSIIDCTSKHHRLEGKTSSNGSQNIIDWNGFSRLFKRKHEELMHEVKDKDLQ